MRTSRLLLPLVLLALLAACSDPPPPADPGPQEPNDHPPSVTLEADRLTGEATFDVTLQAHASDPDGNRLTYAWRVNDELIPQASGPTLRLTIYEAGQYEVGVTVWDGKHHAGASVTLTARNYYRPEDAPDVVIIGFAGRCDLTKGCGPPDGNRAYLAEAPENTLPAIERAFQQLGHTTQAYSFRSHLHDSSARGPGYRSADALLAFVRDEWIRDFRDPTRVVVVAHSHGNQFMSLLAWDHPEVRFDYAIYLDAVCFAWDGDHIHSGRFQVVYGSQDDYPAPLDALGEACDSLYVPGVGVEDISDVVPWNITWGLEVRSNGLIVPGVFRDDDPNHRPDGTRGAAVGLADLQQTDEGHNTIHDETSAAMRWVLDTIALNGLPTYELATQAGHAPLATPAAPDGFRLE